MKVLHQILIRNNKFIIKEFTSLYGTKMPYGKGGQSALILWGRLLVYFHSSRLNFTFP